MNSWLISGIILVIGFFICLFLILRNKWKAKKRHIEDYEAGRNKLTPELKKSQEKKEEVEYESEYSGRGFSLSGIISGFIALLVGVSLFGPIREQVKIASTEMNVTSGGSEVLANSEFMLSILQFIPVVFALGIVIIAIGIVFNNMRGTGLA